ncbi:hypothetical protein, partial [Tetragenococcus halophilus]|uniref:hypothetical protein n=1 Tax=Tetragenococcus halophilus TaxID=51669 RepID=UPI0030101340
MLEGYDAHNVPWERVLQTVKNNYYFFVHDTINKYIEQTTKLENSTVVIAQDLTKNISLIIDDLKKEILAFLATMIASFTLKIDFNLQLLFIGSAWFYSLILFITNKLKLETYFSIRIPWYTKDLMHKINFN